LQEKEQSRSFLVIDAGASRTRLAYINEKIHVIEVGGINPEYHTANYITSILVSAREKIPFVPHEVYYYGAGLSANYQKNKIKRIIKNVFSRASFIGVYHDILGTARAIFGHGRGIACILGTGSNSAYYTGTRIREDFIPGGWILGDEGASSSISRSFLKLVLYHRVPTPILNKFFKTFGRDIHKIVSRTHSETIAFLSRVGKFIIENRDDEYIRFEVVYPQLREFVEWRLLPLWLRYKVPVGFSGSIAFFFSDLIYMLVGDIPIAKIIQDPIYELCKYHTENKFRDTGA